MSKNGHKSATHLRDLIPDPKNARKHTPRNVGTIVDSLHEVGAGRSIVIDENNVVLAGNATIEAAAEAGIEKVQVVDADGQTIIAVRRSGLSQKQKTRLALYDNRAAELAEWDVDVLASIDPALLTPMFSDKELAELLTQTGVEPKDAEPQIDKAEELRQKWGTETGQLWVIGNHRLLVGDATNKADVGRLCANVRPLLMVTDPPYGVELDTSWREDAGISAMGPQSAKGIEWDASADWSEALKLAPVDIAYVWHAGRFIVAVAHVLKDAGFDIKQQIVWNKSVAPFGRAHYHWKHETCWYAVRKGKTAHWIAGADQVTVWDDASPRHIMGGSEEEKQAHPTQKPEGIFARPIRNHSGDVYDPFVGSGTTLVAAENLSRKCYAIEISPAYCAVSLERMTTAFPHLKIEKVDKARAA